MPQLKTHKNCKYFSFKKCPHLKNKIMERATQDVPEYHGGSYQMIPPLPTEKEIDKICEECDTFAQK